MFELLYEEDDEYQLYFQLREAKERKNKAEIFALL